MPRRNHATALLLPLLLVMAGITATPLAAATQASDRLKPNNGCRNTGPAFEPWLAAFKKKAAAEGISRRTISSALDGVTLDEAVLRRDRGQSFFAQSFLSFSEKLAKDYRITNGRKKIAANKRYFDRAEKEYGVPAAVITAFWALESDFGAGMGKLSVLRALATLAWDCRRSGMFNEELIAALKVIDRGDLKPQDMIGSWAGELGQTQFLPTLYLDFAVDWDGDGRRDMFKSTADIIGSTAAYLKSLGWRAGEPWLQEVKVPDDLPWQEADLSIRHPRSWWAKRGVRLANGKPLPADGLPASLLLLQSRHGPAFLAYGNFDAFTAWNQSINYATTAAYLATRIDGAPAMQKGTAHLLPVLDFEEAKELQRQLVKRGLDVGEVDGKIGAMTRAAVRQMQIRYKLPADSYPTPELLQRLRAGR
jgi:lytic murein transglycosylase